MKLNRLIMVSLVGISLSTPAWACEHSGGGILSFFHHCDHDNDSQSHDSKRQCDQNGQNSGTGNNCDHGKGNGGGYCGTGGSTGGSSSGSGGSTKPPTKGTV
jgi:uncharacterized membrane protein YgcG